MLGLIAGLAFLIATLQIHFLVAFVGFLIMLGCAFVIERNIRQVGKVGIQDIAGAVRSSRDDDGKSLRDRFRRS